MVVKYFKTGYLIPADHIFEDLKQINRQLNGSMNTNTTNNQNMTNTTTLSTNSNSSSSSMNGTNTNTNNNMPMVQLNTTSLTLQNSLSNNRQKKISNITSNKRFIHSYCIINLIIDFVYVINIIIISISLSKVR